MPRRLLVMVLLLAPAGGTRVAGLPAVPGRPVAQAAAPTGAKVIKDRAEYDVYMAALAITDPAKKAAALDAFAARYPDSVVKIDALEETMAAYQQAGDLAGTETSARRLLAIQPDNVRVLAVVAFIGRARASGGAATDAAVVIAQLRADAARGLAVLPGWPGDAGMSDAQVTELRREMTGIFTGAAGFAALQAKDYAAARGFYQRALEIDSSDVSNAYQIGVAELAMSPADATGFWHLARAAALARDDGNGAGAKAAVDYGLAHYRDYHGGDDGWDRILSDAATQTAPPADFSRRVSELQCAISDPSQVSAGDSLAFTATVTGGPAGVTPVFGWSISAGTILSGQRTATIHVSTTGLGGSSITATVEIMGFARSCFSSETAGIRAVRR